MLLKSNLSLGFAIVVVVGQPTPSSAAGTDLQVDLGYSIYEGVSQGPLNAWLGIRYAAPPLGDNRWRAPELPATNRSAVVSAAQYGPVCPQVPNSPLPAGFPYGGDEDCLFINVWAPPGAQNLPVMFNIHGGGYGTGNGQLNMSEAPLSIAANHEFVSVFIQYRLEAFGFLASPDIKANGSLNAGLLDQRFALEWTQRHVEKFGGDPARVTIVGQSAGAGSVLLQAMANGGEDGSQNFAQVIASSPFTPAMYSYSDDVPIQRYQRFATESGCGGDESVLLECLRQMDTDTLQKANALVGAGVNYGSWAFVPVVDRDLIRQRPSQQLVTGKVNGQRVLTSHNANEGASFVPINITTASEFDHWLLLEYPLLSQDDINNINTVHYPYRNVGETPYASCGDCGGATSLNVGSFATGHQQRAINLYSELTFDCPSYWLAEGFTNSAGRGYKYEYSVVPSTHGLDLGADGIAPCPNVFAPDTGPSMCAALSQAWANFIMTGDPSISDALANGDSGTVQPTNPASDWPVFTSSGSQAWEMLNVNQSGGVLSTRPSNIAGLGSVAVYTEPGLKNDIQKVNAYDWEGGRGAR